MRQIEYSVEVITNNMREKKSRIIFHILWQLDFIVALFVWIFSIAPYSYYAGYWSEEILQIINSICRISYIILATLFLSTLVFLIKSKFGIKEIITKELFFNLFFVLIIFAGQIFIRYNMLGSYQLSDGLTFYSQIEELLFSPERMIKDFIHSGFIAGGHISHGFIFFHLLGQLVKCPTGMGFQYSYMILGSLSACCLYGILRKLLPDAKRYLCAIGAFIISVQPMFLGLSTIAQMEYVITVTFIFSLFFIMYNHQVLAAFWLLILGTCKETGLMMAFFLIGMLFIIPLIRPIIRNGGLIKTLRSLKLYQHLIYIGAILLCIIVLLLITNVPLWNGYKIIDVLKENNDGNMKFYLDPTHLSFKLSQLFVLNFSWLWALLLLLASILCISVSSIRKKTRISGLDFSYIVTSYIVYTVFLLLFLEAKQPRYNMLSNVLFLLIAVTVILKFISAIKLIGLPVLLAAGWFTFVQAFVTIDPLSIEMFTNINTGGKYPIVWTYSYKKDIPTFYINPGDFGMYNYHYSYVDKAVDAMLKELQYRNDYTITSTSNYQIEDQLSNTGLCWDSKNNLRTYHRIQTDDQAADKPYLKIFTEHYYPVNRCTFNEQFESSYRDDRILLFQSPYFEDLLEEYSKLLCDEFTVVESKAIQINNFCTIKYKVLIKN